MPQPDQPSNASAAATPLDTPSSLSSLVAALKDETAAAASGSSIAEEPAATAAQEPAAEEEEEDDEEDEDDGPPVNPLSDGSSSEEDDDDGERSDVLLGFLEEALHPKAMTRGYFPCKAGGKPAWLNPKNLPTQKQLTCEHCNNPMLFLMQLYSPLRTTFGSHPGSFHRSLFLFCCLQGSCSNKPRSIVCLRSQLPRANDFYPPVALPKLEEVPLEEGQSLPVLEDEPVPGVHLCCICGNPAPSACSRCQSRRYCSKQHQLLDWKAGGHKALCAPKGEQAAASSSSPSSSSSASSTPSSTTPAPAAHNTVPLLFPQKEVVIEPEDDSDSDDSDAEDAAKGKKKEDFSKEQKLLEEYQKQKEAQADDEEEEDEEELASAVSNWASPKLKDPLFLRFKARIAAAPEQVLRYERASGADARTQPLWVSNWNQPASPPAPEPRVVDGKRLPVPRAKPPTAQENDAAIPACAHCGGKRRFEFQVLPQLLYYLGPNSSALDFANLVVYSCEHSCGDGATQYFEEFVWLQAPVQ